MWGWTVGWVFEPGDVSDVLGRDGDVTENCHALGLVHETIELLTEELFEVHEKEDVAVGGFVGGFWGIRENDR